MTTLIKHLRNAGEAKVRLMISEDNWLETAAVDQLIKTVELPGMLCGVGLPDLHPGKGQPIGAAFITKNCIYPHLVGSDIGCGMGLWKLEVLAKKVKPSRWEKKLIDLDGPWGGDKADWLEREGLREPESDALALMLLNANEKLGTIGGGNHFVEIQQVNEVFDELALLASGLQQQSTVLLVHSGSRGLGQSILRHHVDQYQSQSLPILKGYREESAAKTYLSKHDYAVRWAMANRALIAKRFSDCLGLEVEKLMSVSHNTVSQMSPEKIAYMDEIVTSRSSDSIEDTPEDTFWLHRKGANPTDQEWVMIPGSRGSLSYLVKPKRDDQHAMAAGAFSLAHGAGRKWKRSDTRGRLRGRFHAKDLEVTKFGSRVICKSKDLLYEEAPQAYKNIDVVIRDMEEAGMIDVVASFKPLITYKTRRS